MVIGDEKYVMRWFKNMVHTVPKGSAVRDVTKILSELGLLR